MASISFPTSFGGVNIPGTSSNPLGALFSDPFAVDGLKYPRDLGASTRTHYLKFNIYDIEPATLSSETLTKFQSAVSSPDLTTAKGLANLGTATADLIGAGLGAIVDNISLDSQNSAMVGVNDKQRVLRQTISLYIPDDVNFNYQSNYNETDVPTILSKMPGAIGAGLGKFAELASSDPAKIFLRTQGLAINPNQQVLFDGVNLREFSFQFNFMPKSAEESDDVRKIVNAFKYYSRPQTVKNSFGMIFKAPSIFSIEFRFLNSENRWVNKVADSALINMEVNYTPNGWATHQDGSPVNTTLKLDFKELSIIDRDKAKAGY